MSRGTSYTVLSCVLRTGTRHLHLIEYLDSVCFHFSRCLPRIGSQRSYTDQTEGHNQGDELKKEDAVVKTTTDFSEIRRILASRPLQGGAAMSSGMSGGFTTAELPIAGARMPSISRAETGVSRLLGRSGASELTHLKQAAQQGSVGASVAKAIQNFELRGAPVSDMQSALSSKADLEELLEQWDEMLKAGEHEAVTKQMQARPGDVDDILQAIADFELRAKKAEEKAGRRAREEAIKAAFAAKRVRKVDQLGRAYATGKRKCSIARVYIREAPEHRPTMGQITVNGRPFPDYFKPMLARMEVLKPFTVTNTLGQFDMKVTVCGGGFSGQAQAVRHGLSKALQNWDPNFRPALRASGFLTRDSRIVERKKPGKAKARKSFQWVKR